MMQTCYSSSKLGSNLLMDRTFLINNSSPFKWRHFEAEIIVLCCIGYVHRVTRDEIADAVG